MSDSDFLIDVKSSLDKVMNDLVEEFQVGIPDLTGADVDNLVETDAFFKSTSPVLLWQFLTMIGAPRDPLYKVTFLVGVKTVSDASNYKLVTLSNQLRKSFEVQTRIEIGDYTGASAVLNTGYLLVTDNTFAPQQYDHMSGVRFFVITAIGARLV